MNKSEAILKEKLKVVAANKALAQKYRSVFSTKDGHAVLMDILTDCHVLQPLDSLDTNQIMLINGKRNAGLEIARKATFDLNKFYIAVGGDTNE